MIHKRLKQLGEPYWPYLDRLRDHPYIVPVTTFLVIFFVCLVAFIGLSGGSPVPSDARVVEFYMEGEKQSLPTRARTVGEFLERINVTLGENDIVEPTKNTPIDDEKFHINVYRARPVTIIDGGNRTFAYSAAVTPRSVAQQAGIMVYPEDKVETTIPDNFLKEGVLGEKVSIERSVAANINLYGAHVPVRTLSKTVNELLREKNVKLEPGDTVQPALDAPITPQLQIFVLRPGTQIATTEEVIPMPMEVIEDQSLSFGVQVVRQQGTPGKRVVTYQIQLVNGQEVGRTKIQEIVSVEAVKQIVARGKAVYIPADKSEWMAAAGISPSDYPYVDYIMSHESGWCPTKVQGQYGACPPFPPASIPTGRGYGIGQATPGTKMSPYGADWQTNAVTQLKWAIAYVKGRYGSWQAAYNYWLANKHW